MNTYTPPEVWDYQSIKAKTVAHLAVQIAPQQGNA